MEVKIISAEIIKPSSPTPSDRKSFNVSLLDQAFPPVQLPMLLFYPNTNNENNIITTLKTSLAETLSRFYPLAGRLHDEHTVSCNDQGIPFIHAYVTNCLLSDVLNSPHKLEVARKCFPSNKGNRNQSISEVVPLTFQVNEFACGGVVIGCYFLHKLLDGASMSTFLNYWAAVARNRSHDVVEPDFDAGVLAFPPSLKFDNGNNKVSTGSQSVETKKASPASDKPINVVLKSFIFNSTAINKLKGMASSEELPNPTAFEAVAGFIWQQAYAAASTSTQMQSAPDDQQEEVASRIVLSVIANLRGKTIIPPLPKQTMGNLTTTVHAWADKRVGLTGLAAEIHATVVSKVKQNVDALVLKRERDWQPGVEGENAGQYMVSSWCKLGLSEVDFGFGKPTRVIPIGVVTNVLRNLIILVDYNDVSGDAGVEAWLFLDEKEMQILESNPQFLEFASPS